MCTYVHTLCWTSIIIIICKLVGLLVPPTVQSVFNVVVLCSEVHGSVLGTEFVGHLSSSKLSGGPDC